MSSSLAVQNVSHESMDGLKKRLASKGIWARNMLCDRFPERQNHIPAPPLARKAKVQWREIDRSVCVFMLEDLEQCQIELLHTLNNNKLGHVCQDLQRPCTEDYVAGA